MQLTDLMLATPAEREERRRGITLCQPVCPIPAPPVDPLSEGAAPDQKGKQTVLLGEKCLVFLANVEGKRGREREGIRASDFRVSLTTGGLPSPS